MIAEPPGMKPHMSAFHPLQTFRLRSATDPFPPLATLEEVVERYAGAPSEELRFMTSSTRRCLSSPIVPISWPQKKQRIRVSSSEASARLNLFLPHSTQFNSMRKCPTPPRGCRLSSTQFAVASSQSRRPLVADHHLHLRPTFLGRERPRPTVVRLGHVQMDLPCIPIERVTCGVPLFSSASPEVRAVVAHLAHPSLTARPRELSEERLST